MTYSYLPVHIEFPLPRLLLLCRRMPLAMAMRRKGMRRPKQSREVVRVSFWANKDVEWCKMESKVVNAIKAVKIDKYFSLYKLQRGIVGLLWNRRKLWGTVRRVCNAALLRPKRATDEEEQEDERTLDVRVGRELYGVEGEKAREWWWTITGSQQGQCKFGMVGRRISLQTPPSPRALRPSTLFLALVLFHAVIAFKTSLHASSTPH